MQRDTRPDGSRDEYESVSLGQLSALLVGDSRLRGNDDELRAMSKDDELGCHVQ